MMRIHLMQIFNLMKKVEAIIRKSKFDDVKNALHEVEVNFSAIGMLPELEMKSKVMYTEGISYSTSEIQRRFLSIVVSDEFADRTVEAIIKSGATGNVGDGKNICSSRGRSHRIRTGEKEALP